MHFFVFGRRERRRRVDKRIQVRRIRLGDMEKSALEREGVQKQLLDDLLS